MVDGLHRGRELFDLGTRLGGLGTVAIGSGGGELAQTLARAAGCGAALAGAEVRFYDGSCAACGAWLGAFYGFAASLFVRQRGEETAVYLFDGRGRPLRPEKLPLPSPAGKTGQWDLLLGSDAAWAADRAGDLRLGGLVCARGPAGLALLLERMGCQVAERPRPGTTVLHAAREGFVLTAEAAGQTFRPPGTDALDAAARFLTRPMAVPAFGTEQNREQT